MNKGILVLLIIILLGGYWWWSGSQNTEVANQSADLAAGTQLASSETPTVDENGNELIGGDAVSGDSDNTPEFAQQDAGDNTEEESNTNEVSFDVKGGSFFYDITEIRVKEGDTVTINFESTGGFHDWVVDEFNAATEKVSTGEGSSVTFVADKKGVFEYYCSVGSHRSQGQVGTLIVE